MNKSYGQRFFARTHDELLTSSRERSLGRVILLIVILNTLTLMRTFVTGKTVPNEATNAIRLYGNKSTSGRDDANAPTSTNNNTLSNNVNDEDEDFHVAYSGYLRDGGSSMLMLRAMDDDVIVGTMDNNRSGVRSLTTNENNHHQRRTKRGVTHLYNMIVCATGCDPLSYKGYACYCGFLGSGYPMDGIDRCCKMHDLCYDATECPMFVEYFVPYYWKCYGGYKPVCAIEHGEWGSSGSCAQRLCECDRSFVECLRRYRCPRHKAICTSSPWRFIQNIFMII